MRTQQSYNAGRTEKKTGKHKGRKLAWLFSSAGAGGQALLRVAGSDILMGASREGREGFRF